MKGQPCDVWMALRHRACPEGEARWEQTWTEARLTPEEAGRRGGGSRRRQRQGTDPPQSLRSGHPANTLDLVTAPVCRLVAPERRENDHGLF